MTIRLRNRHSSRKVWCWLALFAALTFSTPTVWAHAKLLRSQPQANSTAKQAPKLVELWFSEELEQGFNTIEVKDQQGQRVDRGDVTLSEGNKKAQVELGELGSGTYTVAWKALSTDEHTMRGQFTFKLEESGTATRPAQGKTGGPPGAGTTAEPQGSMMPMATNTGEGEQVLWGQTIVRWLSYIAMMSLFGGFAFRLLVLGPALRPVRSEAAGAKALRVSTHRVVRLLLLNILLLVLTSLAALVLQASQVFDKSIMECMSPPLLGQVITGTGYGSSWFLQMLAVTILLVVVLLLNRRRNTASADDDVALWWTGLAAAAVLLIAPSWTGHAAAAIKDFRLAVFTDWLHLLAGGFWVGGLFHLAMSANPALAPLSTLQRTQAVHRLISLFTRIAIPSVVLLVLAGLYNTWVHVESFRSLWDTAYGKTLLLKLLLVFVMLLLGGINNFIYGKQAAKLARQGEDESAPDHDKLGSGFSRSVALEAVLGIAVLLVTAVLVFLMPARTHPPVTSIKTSGSNITQNLR